VSVNGSRAGCSPGSEDSHLHCVSVTERIEWVIDDFETHWPRDTGDELWRFASDRKLLTDVAVLVELVRVDVERRYQAGFPVDLEIYWQIFPKIRSDRSAALAVAYEDYRSRCSAGLSVPAERWSALEGVHEANWFRQLKVGSGSVAVTPRSVGSNRVLLRRVEQAGFKIVARIGEGAFSQVFLATQRDLAHRHVVLKVVDRPLAEPDRMARLQHTNIVPIYSFHRIESHSILCMPYAGMMTLADYLATSGNASGRSGHSLVATLKRRIDDTLVHLPDRLSAITHLADDSNREPASTELGALIAENGAHLSKPRWDNPAVDAPAAMQPLEGLATYDSQRLPLFLFSKLASALAHAHDRGVLHGDLKPANVLIRNDGEPALLDFNLSIAIEGSDPQWAGGTLAYMAPEMIRALMGQRVSPERSADIYGLGVMLFEFLNGELPFRPPRSCAAVDLEEGLRARRSSLRWSNALVSPGTRAIVERCLALEAKDRYQSAEHLQEDLIRELQDLPLRHTREPTLLSRLRKWTRRHPRLCSSAVVASMCVLAISLLSLAGWELSEANRRFMAREQYQRFIADSSRTAAELLMPATFGSDAAIASADSLLDSYHLLSDDRWMSRPEWSYLSEDHRNSLEIRIADLLVRSISRRIDRADSGEGKTEDELAAIARRLELLRQAPFERHAPKSLNHLQDSVDRIAAGGTRMAGPLPDDPLPEADATVDRLAKALERISANRPREALEWLAPSMLETIDAFSYWIAVGQAQMSDGQLRAAELSFTLAIREMEDSPVGHYYRGVCRRRLGQPHDLRGAEFDFSQVLAVDPSRDEAMIERALVREVLQDYTAAISDLDVVIGGGRHLARSLVQRSRVYGKLGRSDDARRDLDAAMQNSPQTAADWLSRGFARIVSDPSGALEDFRMAESLDPKSVIALQNQAFILSEHLGRETEAAEVLSRLLQIAPSFQPAQMGRAVLRARGGDVAGAIADLEFAEGHAELAPASLYQAACVYALLAADADPKAIADPESRCFHYLSRAVRRGYGENLLATDPDLNSIRNDHRYLAILQTLRMSQSASAD
jgi:eukaryotic-like serine/threonine-protein kinase